MSQLATNVGTRLRLDDLATVFVVGDDQRLVTVGFVRTDGRGFSASPRLRR